MAPRLKYIYYKVHYDYEVPFYFACLNVQNKLMIIFNKLYKDVSLITYEKWPTYLD